MEFIGGFRCGGGNHASFNATWPFACLKISADGLQLKIIFRGTYYLNKDQIIKISNYSGYVSSGLNFEHIIKDYPPMLVFWTSKIEPVKADLVHYGYPVDLQEKVN